MEKKSNSLKTLIVVCTALCALFVAFISYQSWGTLEYITVDIPEYLADIQWLRITIVVVRYILALALVATLLVFLNKIWRWLYSMSALYFIYALVDGNTGNIIYKGMRQLEIYINEYMLITCFVLIVFAKLYSIAVEVSEEQELTI